MHAAPVLGGKISRRIFAHKLCPIPRHRCRSRVQLRVRDILRKRHHRHPQEELSSRTFPHRLEVFPLQSGCVHILQTPQWSVFLQDPLHRTCIYPSCRGYRSCQLVGTVARQTDRHKNNTRSQYTDLWSAKQRPPRSDKSSPLDKPPYRAHPNNAYMPQRSNVPRVTHH